MNDFVKQETQDIIVLREAGEVKGSRTIKTNINYKGKYKTESVSVVNDEMGNAYPNSSFLNEDGDNLSSKRVTTNIQMCKGNLKADAISSIDHF